MTILFVALSQNYKPVGFFQNQNNEKCNYPTLFFGMSQKPSILTKYQYQDIVQWELMHQYHLFASHIPNLFLKAIKVLIQKVKYGSWIKIHKSKLSDHVLRAKYLISKPNLDNITL
jgi:hypothetical protein